MQSTLFIAVIISSCGLKATSGATVDDAITAFRNFDILSRGLMDNISEVAQDQWKIFQDQLDAEKSATSNEINAQVDNILGKISQMITNVENANIKVGSCADTVNRDVNGFASDMRDRLDDCYDSMMMDGNAYLDTSWGKVLQEYSTDIHCTNVSLIQCQLFEGGADCYDFVISNVGRLRDKVAKAYNAIRVEILNKMTSLTFPCRRMIVQEMGLYPTLILEFANACLAAPVTQGVLTGC